MLACACVCVYFDRRKSPWGDISVRLGCGYSMSMDLTSPACRKCVKSCQISTHIDEILVPRRKQEEFKQDTCGSGGVLGTLFNNELYNGDTVLPSGLPLVILSLSTRQLVFHTLLRSSHDNHTDAVIRRSCTIQSLCVYVFACLCWSCHFLGCI